MKKKILIDATGSASWIGGLYYRKNIIFSLLSNKKICRKYDFVLVTEPENISSFAEFSENIEIIPLLKQKNKIRKIKILLICLKKSCKFIFPSGGKVFTYFGILPIRWIPDFQHNHFPEFFPPEDIAARNADYRSVAENSIPLVLSSQDCMRDFKHYYPSDKANIYVVPFVSYIEPIINNLTNDRRTEILKKHGIANTKYACVMNQFWRHKNHIIVLQAMQNYYTKHPESEFYFVFTGKMEDYRNPEYIKSLKQIMEDNAVASHIKMLGFIDREEQLAVMSGAEYVIQPSLFEGWGTVVEDAKVLDKTVLLSNIPVHREQKNGKCILFDPHDAEKLADLIETENGKEHIDDIKAGVEDMYVRAEKYSKEFERLLQEAEKSRR